MEKLIHFLGESSPPLDKEELGGKGAVLSELKWLKYNVPEGFILPSKLFDLFLKENGFKESVNRIIKENEDDSIESIKTISVKLIELILSGIISNSIINAVDKAYCNLNNSLVSVRSSAAIEDGQEVSFAGQFKTYLNVNKENLYVKIKECWSSFFTLRSLSYRREQNIDLSNVNFAVICQKMINSDTSGVCFTTHPIYQNDNLLTIDVVSGLGESLVSGIVTPDNYIIDKKSIQIKNRTIVKQPIFLVLDREKKWDNKWKVLPQKDANKAKISDNIVIEIAKICKDIECISGYPCDIEWSVYSNTIYILQCRPITVNNQ